MDCLINVEGGLGKNVMLTSILQELKNEANYKRIYVMSPYFDVFKGCLAVDDAFPTGQPSLYQELVLNPDVEVLWKEPYNNDKFIKKTCHLFNAWREEFGLDTDARCDENGANIIPQLDSNLIREEYPELAKLVDKKLSELGKFIMVQFCGGQSPLGDMKAEYQERAEGIKRNYYKGQELINLIKEEYPEHTIVHYALPNEPSYDNTIKIEMPYLGFVLLADHADKVVCTDSSLQHLATGHCNDITVIWGETRPEHFGYACNKNIAAPNVCNSQAYFRPLGVSPAIIRMPSPEEVMEIIKQ